MAELLHKKQSERGVSLYSNTGYLNHSDIEIEDNIHPLIIGSCGIYRMLTVPALRTTRPQGRRDYQLLYVFGGTAVFQKCGRSFTAPAGTFIVYTPGEPQDYEYSASRKTEVCWVHFSGKEVPDLLRQAGFDREGILDGGILPEYHQFFLQMIQELQFGRPCYEELLALLFRQLLMTVRRHSLECGPDRVRIPKEIQEAVHYFNEHFSEPISIEEYAKNQHISVCWFIRSFRLAMGMPPMQYITSVRLNRARMLLESTDYPIQEIGAMVGYDNPLYFSRIFKKQMGEPPSRYRKH